MYMTTGLVILRILFKWTGPNRKGRFEVDGSITGIGEDRQAENGTFSRVAVRGRRGEI